MRPSIGIVFTALFALGVVLVTAYAGQVDLDQECVLYGEIAYTPWDTLIWNGVDVGPRPVWILGVVFILNMLFVCTLYKELKIASFDSAMAMAVGVNATLIHYLLM
ncbi:MAG: metal ABC transporter permease, partial [Candidatus Latescibacterota bacterium]